MITIPIGGHDDKIARGADAELTLVANDTARAWIVALGCRDYSLFDFRIDPDGRPWFVEAGLYCSFARQSVISVMAAAAGIPLPELFANAVGQALRRGPVRE